MTPGTRIGVYEIIAPIGEGGMGVVYRATDTSLCRQVAIKVLPDVFAADAERLARFEREAKTLAALNHPNIAQIYGLEKGRDGPGGQVGPFLVMELVEGEDLSERIARLRAQGASARQAGIPLDEALPIARQIAEALEAAHEQGIIHRDLKPANIKVRVDGTAKVLDFGLAKAIATGAGRAGGPAGVSRPDRPDRPDLSESPTLTSPAQMTGVGVILGTAAYMSPEQAKGRPVDRRADIWAFGCVLYEMLTGTRLFAGESVAETLGLILSREPDLTTLPPDTPVAVRRLVVRCLKKDARARLRDIGEARAQLEELLSGAAASVEGAQAPPTVAQGRSTPRGARLAWLVAAVAVLAAGGFVVPALQHLRESPQAQLPIRFEIQAPPTDAPLSFAVSPDGRQLAFVASADGNVSRLWIRSLERTSAEPLAGTDGATYPFWSPDSRSLGFFAGGRLKRIDASGAALQDLATAPSGRGGTWNREGIILFAPDTRSGLVRVDAGGGPTTPVAREGFGRPVYGPRFPQFLPDGRRFLYYLQLAPPELRGVYLGSLDSAEMVRVLVADTTATYASPGYLLGAGQDQLVAWRFDVSRGVVNGDPLPIAGGVGADSTIGHGAFSVSETGVLVHRASTGAQRRQLTWVDRTGRALGTVGAANDTTSPSGPELAPDGRRIAWYQQVQGNTDVWLMDVGRGVESRFVYDTTSDVAPLWSPDGSRVVFASSRKGIYDLFEKTANGVGDERALLVTPEFKVPLSWSADGRFLLYRNANAMTQREDLWALPMTGDKTPFPVVQSDFDKTEGQFSPDSRWVAYVSNESRRFEVMVRPFPRPGETVQVSTAGGSQVRWRQDGKELCYIAPDGRMMAVSIAAGNADQALVVGPPVPLFSTRLATGSNVTGSKPQYAVAPDGRFLLNARVDEGTTPPLTVVVNWHEALTRAAASR